MSRPLNSETISYGIAPRINAVGRLDDAAIALDLLLTKDQDEANRLVMALNNFNVERQDEQRRMISEAIELMSGRDMTDVKVLVLSSSNWNPGVVGIVAGKIAERYYRPTVVIGVDESGTRGKGSAKHAGKVSAKAKVETFAADIVAASAPFAVTDQDGRLVGEIAPQAVIDLLAGRKTKEVRP